MLEFVLLMKYVNKQVIKFHLRHSAVFTDRRLSLLTERNYLRDVDM